MKNYGFHKIPSIEIYLKNINALIATGHKRLVSAIDSSFSHAPLKLIPTQSGWLSAVLKNHTEKHIHDTENPIEDARSQVAKIQNPSRDTLILGAGLGYHIGILCDVSQSTQKIMVYERYPEFLKLALSIRDYSREILKRKLQFFTWNSLHILKAKLARKKNLQIWKHPVLWNFYFEEYQLLTSPIRKSDIRCIVLLTGLMCRDIYENLLEMGIETYPLDVTHINPDVFKDFIKSYSPNFIISINYVKGVSRVCSDYGVPFIVWEIDPTIEILTADKSDKECTIYYTYKKSRIPFLINIGFKHVFFLPLATNHLRFTPQNSGAPEKGHYLADISFVGSSMVNQGKRLKTLLFNSVDPLMTEKLSAAVSKQLDHLEEYILPCALKEICPSISDPWIIRDKNGILIDGILCLAEECASRRRIELINSLGILADKYIIKVWGDKGWQKVLNSGIKYCGTAGHFYELPVIYRASKINLDINRLYQKDIVPMRIFDILATRSFVLADYSPDLDILFDGNVIGYRSSDELIKLAEYYLEHPEERNEIAAKGYEIVVQKHTIMNRLYRILSDLRTLSWL